MKILRGHNPQGYPVDLEQIAIGSAMHYVIVVDRNWGKVIPVVEGRACVALEDAILEFRAACKLSRIIEQMGGNGKRKSNPVEAAQLIHGHSRASTPG